MLLRSLSVLAGSIFLLASCQSARTQEAATPEAVTDTYVAIAQATYADSVAAATGLGAAVNDFLAEPGAGTLAAARQAWLASRVPYMQTEAYRFGNPVVDEWEPRVNAWPLDEGLIDYVADAYGEQSPNNYFYSANVIANPALSIGGIEVDASAITPRFLAGTLHMIDGVESNVATGYHAIEFLLWGQDLHGTEPGAGERPWTDYSLEQCTHANCGRRRDYLEAATSLLITDLETMAASWREGGAAYEDFMGKPVQARLATMLTGMGSLAYGELAGERTRLALLLNDPEEEQDCFSDNTHNSHYYDAMSIANVYQGEYQRIDGSVVSGPSLADLVEAEDSQAAAAMRDSLAETHAAMTALVESARTGATFDVLIAPASQEGEAILSRVVDALTEETGSIESVIGVLGLENTSIEGSDSLDSPSLAL